MSVDLYWTRLYWDNGKGVAKQDGVSVDLTAPPVIGGVEVDMIDYAPETKTYFMRLPYEGSREMRTDERAATAAFLNLTCERK
jgi:hypothetical protein